MAIITKYPLQNLSLKDSDLHIDLWRFVVFFFFQIQIVDVLFLKLHYLRSVGDQMAAF